jgi:peptidylprolyl isomerase
MKILAVVTVLSCSVLAFSACGDEDSAPATEPLATSSNVTWKQVKSQIVDPQGSPPPEVVVEDLVEGGGAAAKDGDELSVRYINFNYNDGKVYEDTWTPPAPIKFELGRGEVLEAWETGLKGMKPGGRRSLIVPAKDAYGEIPQVYVVELTAIQ